MLIGPWADDTMATLLDGVHKTYVEELNVYCWSSGIMLPPLFDETDSMVIIRLGSRGNCFSEVSDVSSLELFMFNSIDTNQFKTIKALERKIKKLKL